MLYGFSLDQSFVLRPLSPSQSSSLIDVGENEKQYGKYYLFV